MSILTRALEQVPTIFVEPLVDLIKAIFSAPNPSAALERAAKAVAADAADEATDRILGVK